MSPKKKNLLSLLLLPIVLSGCETLTDLEVKFYKQEMYLEANGKYAKGFLVVDKADKYDIKARWDYPVSEMVSIFNCYRDDSYKLKSGFWDRGKKELEYTLIPEPQMEDGEHCPLQISAFDLKGVHAFGTIYFRTNERLYVKTFCNGKRRTYKGVSVCQSREGSFVKLQFWYPITYKTEDDCPELEEVGQYTYEYQSAKGECVYLFLDDEGQWHRHISYGYNEIHLRNSEER